MVEKDLRNPKMPFMREATARASFLPYLSDMMPVSGRDKKRPALWAEPIRVRFQFWHPRSNWNKENFISFLTLMKFLVQNLFEFERVLKYVD